MARTVRRVAPRARLSDTDLPPLDTASPRWPGKHVQVGEADVFVRSTPGPDDAEPALCVHGLGGASTNWTDLAALLRRRLRVEAIDLPGFGYAGPAPHENYSLGTHAAAVIGYLEQTGGGPVHLIANSMGGAISIVVAATRPDLVRSLSLFAPAVPDVRRLRAHPVRHNPRAATLVVPGLGSLAMRQFGGRSARARVESTIDLCFADASRYSRERLAQDVEDTELRDAMPWSAHAFLRSLRGLVRSQLVQGRQAWTLMNSITAPTLVVWGDRDRLVAPDLAAFVADAIPDSRLLELTDIGHVAMMEDPVTSARAVLALVEDADARGSEDRGPVHGDMAT